MYSKMLKLAIAFCIISLCDMAPFQVRDPEIVQRPSVTGSYSQLHLIQTLNSEYGWVISGLWPLHNSQYLQFCENSYGISPIYENDDLEVDVIEELSTKWPPLAHSTAHGTWGLEYNKYGSCITEDSSIYFQDAMQLYDNNLMENILYESGISPGSSNLLNSIISKIKNAIGTEVFVKCVKNQITGKQQISKITLCFDTYNTLVDCVYGVHASLIHQCDRNIKTWYNK